MVLNLAVPPGLVVALANCDSSAWWYCLALYNPDKHCMFTPEELRQVFTE